MSEHFPTRSALTVHTAIIRHVAASYPALLIERGRGRDLRVGTPVEGADSHFRGTAMGVLAEGKELARQPQRSSPRQ